MTSSSSSSSSSILDYNSLLARFSEEIYEKTQIYKKFYRETLTESILGEVRSRKLLTDTLLDTYLSTFPLKAIYTHCKNKQMYELFVITVQ